MVGVFEVHGYLCDVGIGKIAALRMGNRRSRTTRGCRTIYRLIFRRRHACCEPVRGVRTLPVGFTLVFAGDFGLFS